MANQKQIPEGALIVVADGGGARLLRNTGKSGAVELEQVEAIDAKRMAQSSPAGVLPTDTSFKEAGEAGFAKALAQRLNEDALKHRFKDLVLVADAQTLGQIRPLLHKETLALMNSEHAKNLVNSSLDDITRSLT